MPTPHTHSGPWTPSKGMFVAASPCPERAASRRLLRLRLKDLFSLARLDVSQYECDESALYLHWGLTKSRRGIIVRRPASTTE